MPISTLKYAGWSGLLWVLPLVLPAQAPVPAPAAKADTLCVEPTTGATDDDDDDDEEFSIDEDTSESVFDAPDTAGYSEFPQHDLYLQIWNNTKINPYAIRLVNKPDTTVIPLAGYCHPIVNRTTSDFGFRRSRHHYGIDIRLQVGDSVLCAFDGMVRIAQRSRSYGYYVVVRHYNGLETVYAHLSKLLVTPNQPIKAGEAVGRGGSTGRSTGPHLHYELRFLGVPVNPNDIIDFEKNAPHSDTLYLSAAHFEYIKEIEKIRYWTVRKGDTLGHIAQKTGISVGTLCRLNKITRKSIIRPGQRIRYT
jgi:murein DD-endopeptidase MepM/ murein hydrolase activator NlpD